ncbi:MAG TPA: hypothetical protein VK533_00305 [Sphingomonas sp.]|uniref:hypothetical protein n=1 Tax=Sphingomonas sp. TaxID=28214 RepID=UPI002BC29361|nr:hypothetical protein [Sphingomonas sp.]HMI17959.1 hypothetical protein [Sphingomonas sp.]
MDFNPLLIPLLAISIGLFAVIGGVFVKPWLALKQRKMELEAQMVAEKAAQYAAHTDRLEQRVAVLERILTDRSTQLGDEIERLRDAPIN